MAVEPDAPARVRAVALPSGAHAPIRVYVNGEEWADGVDYAVEGDTVHFHRAVRPQPRLGTGRKLMLAMGIGVYGDLKGDTLDLQYTAGGTTHMVNVPLLERASE